MQDVTRHRNCTTAEGSDITKAHLLEMGDNTSDVVRREMPVNTQEVIMIFSQINYTA